MLHKCIKNAAKILQKYCKHAVKVLQKKNKQTKMPEKNRHHNEYKHGSKIPQNLRKNDTMARKYAQKWEWFLFGFLVDCNGC